MQHVVTRVPPPFPAAGGRLRVHTVPAAQDNLVWVIEAADHTAAAVDGPNATAVLDLCAREGLRLTTVLTTHTHGDHIGLHHHLDLEGRLGGLRVVGSAATADAIPGLNEPVVEGDVVAFGGASFEVWRTDGHLTGHVCYVGEDVLFCGDTLFAGGCGKVFDGPMAAMARSLLRLGALPGAVRACCAHEYTLDNLRFAAWVEPDNAALLERWAAVAAIRAEGGCTVPSTLASEQATNPYLRPGSPTIRARLEALCPGVSLDTPVDVIGALRALKDSGRHRAEMPEVPR